ncbi:hypothetical protein JCM19046_2052 [Bacillus sp. JCM 19046]|uniref:Uncharacterized protein YjgD (DUF1641 family) n=1 Tax=Shouchella xiaoxiensis TaxID=766895 RepID=A0ABS2T1K4_9BACI|nr:DUF1641 domain-containing protein [Shouchella xiaoxiensis]MBM7841136.1 uncharacterized protein YjgD (DUF1641 family) [Shouchella xiaoxiensis]GAF14780.1 hypothetical protein JCM19045_4111 [Bacillus sp. JCM 19045]GAF17534.1 hypothetical protein JCM19046_2052 [Bacillus sp. JCM 19046]
MAKATTVIKKMPVDPNKIREKDLKMIEDALIDNKDVIINVLSLLQKANKTEAFNMAHSAFDQSEPLMNQLVKTLDDPHITQALKNVLVISQALGSIKLADLEPMLFKLNSALHQVAEYEHGQTSGGYTSLLRSVRDPETIEGLNTMMAFVKGFGMDQSNREENQSQFERSTLAGVDYQETTRVKCKHNHPAQPHTKWYVVAAGALAFALPLILNRKSS